MRTLKDELNKLYHETLPSYPGHDYLADQSVQIFMDWLVEKLPESVACAYKAILGGGKIKRTIKDAGNIIAITDLDAYLNGEDVTEPLSGKKVNIGE